MSPDVIALWMDLRNLVIWSPGLVCSELLSVEEVLLEAFGACERISFTSAAALVVSPELKSLASDVRAFWADWTWWIWRMN